jgi:hypothetical protein
MNNSIRSFSLNDGSDIWLPVGAEIILVAFQRASITIWFQGDFSDSSQTEERKFRTVATDGHIPYNWVHVWSGLEDKWSASVTHVFEDRTGRSLKPLPMEIKTGPPQMTDDGALRRMSMPAGPPVDDYRTAISPPMLHMPLKPTVLTSRARRYGE